LLPFDEVLAGTSATEFITGLASYSKPLAAICVGHQWSFGKGREGNLEKLALLGQILNFSEIGVPEIDVDNEPVSSTRIRNAVANGEFHIAERLLGRPYTVLGEVQHGRALGRTIGFPTANLLLHNEQLPPSGVYAVRVSRDDEHTTLPGVANLGLRPTVEATPSQPILEVHLLDFNGDLYSETLEVEFISLLRNEQKFPSLEALRQQIGRDTLRARELLAIS
jgi:riboflavin kinase/FMN adenylyltransferase